MLAQPSAFRRSPTTLLSAGRCRLASPNRRRRKEVEPWTPFNRPWESKRAPRSRSSARHSPAQLVPYHKPTGVQPCLPFAFSAAGRPRCCSGSLAGNATPPTSPPRSLINTRHRGSSLAAVSACPAPPQFVAHPVARSPYQTSPRAPRQGRKRSGVAFCCSGARYFRDEKEPRRRPRAA